MAASIPELRFTPPPAAPSPAPTPLVPRGEERRGGGLRDVWETVRSHRVVVASVFLGVLALTAAVTWLQRPVYESGATLRIDDNKSNKDLLGALAPFAGGGKDQVETEMMVLHSRQVAEAVTDSLSLNLEVNEPKASRSSVFSQVRLARTAPVGVYVLARTGDGGYALSRERGNGPAPSVPGRIIPGVPFAFGGGALTLAVPSRASAPAKIVFEVKPYRRTVNALVKGLRVSRPNPDAQIVSVAYQSTDPVLAAGVPNTAARAFIRYKLASSRTESGSTVDFLREQVALYSRQLEGAEGSLRDFRASQHVVNPEAEATEQVKRLTALQAERDELVAERTSLAQLLARVQSERRTADGRSPYRELAGFPTFLQNKAVQDLLQALTAQENRRAELAVRRTDNNADVASVDARIAELERQLFSTASSYLGSVDDHIRSLNTELARFGGEMSTIPSREVEYARRLRQVTLLEEIYKLLQTRLTEAEIQNSVVPGDVRIIDDAWVPDQPVSPRPAVNLALAAILGSVLAIGAAFARQSLDTKVRTREQVVASTGGLPILVTVPRMRATAASVNGNGNGSSPHGAPNPAVARLVTRLDPHHPAAEAFRALRTNLTFASVNGVPRLLVVTSALPGEGKSTTSANLAVTLAQQGVRVLLIDADLRRGTLHQLFQLPQSPGLTHVLTGNATIDEAVRSVPAGNGAGAVDVLTAGVFPPNPSELLGSPAMRELLAELRERYDMVLLDAPPVAVVTDAAVLGTVADGTVLVARANVTDRRALQFASAQLQHLRARVAGVVFNDYTMDQHAYGYGYYASNDS